MVAPGGGAVSYERGTLYCRQYRNAGQWEIRMTRLQQYTLLGVSFKVSLDSENG